jgi:5-methylcytosine-specific restriction endonuclease McrA
MRLPRISPTQREKVRQMFDGRCAYCGNPLGKLWHVDHRRPARRDLSAALATQLALVRGSHDEDNWMPACTRCNQRKGTLSVEEFRGEIRCVFRKALEDCHVKLAVDFKLVRAAKVPRVKFHFEEV